MNEQNQEDGGADGNTDPLGSGKVACARIIRVFIWFSIIMDEMILQNELHCGVSRVKDAAVSLSHACGIEPQIADDPLLTFAGRRLHIVRKG